MRVPVPGEASVRPPTFGSCPASCEAKVPPQSRQRVLRWCREGEQRWGTLHAAVTRGQGMDGPAFRAGGMGASSTLLPPQQPQPWQARPCPGRCRQHPPERPHYGDGSPCAVMLTPAALCSSPNSQPRSALGAFPCTSPSPQSGGLRAAVFLLQTPTEDTPCGGLRGRRGSQQLLSRGNRLTCQLWEWGPLAHPAHVQWVPCVHPVHAQWVPCTHHRGVLCPRPCCARWFSCVQ